MVNELGDRNDALEQANILFLDLDSYTKLCDYFVSKKVAKCS